MASNSVMIHKLQQALNTRGCNILYNTSQFYSFEQNRPVTIYHIKQVKEDVDGRHTTIELFKSVSQIQILLFLRDMWYSINGWEIPQDNPIWNEKKNKSGLGGV